MLRPLRVVSYIALAVGLGACDRPADDPRPVLAEAMKGLLAYPHSSIINMSAGPDAGQANLSSTDSVEQVARWFRDFLRQNNWDVQNDQRAPDGSISLYAEQGKRPVWITMHPNVGGPGTNYTVISGIPDTSSQSKPRGSPQGHRHPTAN
jgi:hypothetical protein